MTPLRPVRIARLGRCGIFIDPALVLALAYLAWTLTERYQVLDQLGDHGAARALLPAGAWVAVVTIATLMSVVGVAALRLVMVRLAGARIRTLTITLLGGPVAIDAVTPARRRAAEWRMALVTPGASLAVGALVLAASALPSAPDLRLVLRDLGRIQLGLGAIGLIPALPLDGGRLLRTLASRRLGVLAATNLAVVMGKTLAAAAVAVAIARRDPRLLFVALYLYGGAAAATDGPELGVLLVGHPARELAGSLPASVLSVNDTVATAARALASAGASALPVVTFDGRLLGTFGRQELLLVPPRARERTTLSSLRHHLGLLIREQADLADVRFRLIERQLSAAAVLDAAGRLLGVVTRGAIDRYLVQLGIRPTTPRVTPAGDQTVIPAPGTLTPAVASSSLFPR